MLLVGLYELGCCLGVFDIAVCAVCKFDFGVEFTTMGFCLNTILNTTRFVQMPIVRTSKNWSDEARVQSALDMFVGVYFLL